MLLTAWPKDGTPIAQESLEVLLKLQNLGLNIIERHNQNFLFNNYTNVFTLSEFIRLHI